ncbi:hypothetical protein D3C81_1521540 [compost metagenome]
MGAPQQEHGAGLVFADHLDDPVGEMLPTFIGMGRRRGPFHGHGGVEQQHALVGPGLQATVVGDVDVEVALEFLVDVEQRRRRGDARLHRKAQPMGLAGAVVRVLAEDHYLDLVQWSGIERIEDQRPRREDFLAGGVLLAQEFAQFGHVGLVELGAQGFLPAGLKFDAVVCGHGFTRKTMGRTLGKHAGLVNRSDRQPALSLTRYILDSQ